MSYRCLLSTAIFAFAFLLSFSEVSAADHASLSATKTQAALKQLKQTGNYNSLMQAVKSARGRDEQAAAPETASIMAQSEKLLAPDGTANDFFGWSVALDGDTAVVGAYFDDGARGAAYVFKRNGADWTYQARLIASDRAVSDNFGWCVAISGNTIVVGAYGDDEHAGAAYVYTSSNADWSEQAKLTADRRSADDYFGTSVAIDGETIVVGANSDDGKGSAFVFVRNNNAWTVQQKLTAPDGMTGDLFGDSVSISNEIIAVGAPFDDINADDQGSAYVFILENGVWKDKAKLFAADGELDDRLGSSIAVSGNTVAAGAPNDNLPGGFDQGSAYVFTGSGSNWAFQAKIVSNDAMSSDYFATRLSLSGDELAISAPYHNVGANSDQGAAYIFTRSGSNWTQYVKLVAADGTDSDTFGRGVAISGNNVFVGSGCDDIGSNFEQGSAYVFRILSSDWTQETKTASSDGAAGDDFGYSIAVSGNTAVVGARYADVNSNLNQGAAYVFVRGAQGWTQQQKITATDGAEGDEFGSSVAIYGDTIVIGAPRDSVNFTSQGSAYVFVRSGSGWIQQAQLTEGAGAAESDNFGSSVSIWGNTAVVGAPLDDSPTAIDRGAAFVFTRSGLTWSFQQKLTADDSDANDQLGWSVAVSGNTAIVGAYLDNAAFSDQGSAYIFTRSGNAWSQIQKLTAQDAAANDRFGFSVALDGNTAIVGAPLKDAENTDQGAVYVYNRSGSFVFQQKLVVSDAAASEQFGYSVAVSGENLIVGAPFSSEHGAAYIFDRAGANWSERKKLADEKNAANEQFGFSVGISCDKVVIGTKLATAPSVSGGEGNLASGIGSAQFFLNSPLEPSAETVPITGRIFSPDGRGVASAYVYLTDQNGTTKTAMTNSFGYYRFAGVSVGQNYNATVVSKRFQFAPQSISVTRAITDLNFTAQQ